MLISEIGNNHFGDFKKAKEMIRISYLCGANLVKGQAFKAEDIKGSMPPGFYRLCQFSLDQYIELIEYGRSIGVEVFFSIFSESLREIENHMNYFKVAGSQTRDTNTNWLKEDGENTFVSIPKDASPPHLEQANVLYVSDYLVENPELDYIDFLADFYERPCGYSDHTIGIENCLSAIQNHNANIIEKHFGLEKNMAYIGHIFRDTIHCASPDELEKIATAIKPRGVFN